MDRKIYDDYIAKYNSLKLDVIENISEFIEKEEYHRFVDPFFIHFVEGEVAITKKCIAIEYSYSEGRFEIVTSNGFVETSISQSDAMGYEFESLLDIYTRLVYELREERIKKIKQVFCDMDLSTIAICGNKPIFITMESGLGIKKLFVDTIYLNEDGEVEVKFETKLTTLTKKVSDLALDELDTLLGYVKESTEKEYNVIVSVRLSRPINVRANSWEEACEKAKKMLDEHPLNEKEDGDGIEVWEN